MPSAGIALKHTDSIFAGASSIRSSTFVRASARRTLQ